MQKFGSATADLMDDYHSHNKTDTISSYIMVLTAILNTTKMQPKCNDEKVTIKYESHNHDSSATQIITNLQLGLRSQSTPIGRKLSILHIERSR